MKRRRAWRYFLTVAPARRAARRQGGLFQWISGMRCANLRRSPCASRAAIRHETRTRRVPLLLLLAAVARRHRVRAGVPLLAARRQRGARSGRTRGAHRAATCPCPAAPISRTRRSWSSSASGSRTASSRRSSRITARITRRSTSGCRRSGLRTYTPEEIRRQIAQAEIDAYFRNDPDAALAASRRLGASFVLRGLISSQATRNPMMAVNQVSVNMGFTLTGSNGRVISDTRGEFELLCRRGRAADGADARQRKGGRSRREAVRRLLPQRGPASEMNRVARNAAPRSSCESKSQGASP